MAYDRDDFAALDDFPSRIEGDEKLADNRLEVLKKDLQWREEHTDMQKCARLYHGNQGAEEQDEIPRVNKIQTAVDEQVSVAKQNVPKVEMTAAREVARFTNPMKQAIMQEVVNDSEQTVNALLREILLRNKFDKKYEKALRQAGIYGVGYIKTDIDRAMDTRKHPELRRLLEKDMSEWNERDAKLYRVLSQRIVVEQPDSRDVVFEHGHRDWDKDILRVSEIERASTRALRVKYQNENIRPGKFPHYVREDPESDGDITAVITTWELEPVYVEKTVDRAGQSVTSQFTSWQMVKTKIAGGELVEKDISDPFESRARLPIIPVYLRESENHPYGEPLPLKMEESENFINLMRVILYRSAKNAASSQAAVVDTSKITSQDKKRLERAFDQGGIAALEGIPQGKTLEQIVQPLNMNSSLSSAPIEAMQNEERTFQEDSHSLDMKALNRAESGAAKRAQIKASDRSKKAIFSNVTRAKISVYDNVYEIMQLVYGDEELPAIARSPDGTRQEATLNQQVQDQVPKVTNQGELLTSPSRRGSNNKLGVVTESFSYNINNVRLPMVAETKWDNSLPGNPINRFNQLLMYLQTGLITREYFRELQLSDKMLAEDNAKRKEAKRQRALKKKRQRMQQAAQASALRGDNQTAAQIMDGQPPENLDSGPESNNEIPSDPSTGGTPGSNGQAGDGVLALQSLQGAEGPSAESGNPTPQEEAQTQVDIP